MFGLKEPYFLPNIATNLLKKTTTLPTDNIIQQDRKIVKVKYVLLSIENKKNWIKKNIYFFS